MGQLLDFGLWISKRARVAVLALLAVAAVKTAAAALVEEPPAPGEEAVIQPRASVASQ